MCGRESQLTRAIQHTVGGHRKTLPEVRPAATWGPRDWKACAFWRGDRFQTHQFLFADPNPESSED